jgi:hypothetical protein
MVDGIVVEVDVVEVKVLVLVEVFVASKSSMVEEVEMQYDLLVEEVDSSSVSGMMVHTFLVHMSPMVEQSMNHLRCSRLSKELQHVNLNFHQPSVRDKK